MSSSRARATRWSQQPHNSVRVLTRLPGRAYRGPTLPSNRFSNPGRKPGDHRSTWVVVVALSTLGILIATLHSAGTELPPGWSLTLTSGDTALAELIQNLLLFIPLGISLVLAGVRPLRAVAIGAGLSLTVEFLQ